MVAYFSILKISKYQATIRLKSGRILGNLRLYSNMELLIKKCVRDDRWYTLETVMRVTVTRKRKWNEEWGMGGDWIWGINLGNEFGE